MDTVIDTLMRTVIDSSKSFSERLSSLESIVQGFKPSEPSLVDSGNDYFEAFKAIDIFLDDIANADRSSFGEDDLVSLVNIYNGLRDSGFIDRYLQLSFEPGTDSFMIAIIFAERYFMYKYDDEISRKKAVEFLKNSSDRIIRVIGLKEWINEFHEGMDESDNKRYDDFNQLLEGLRDQILLHTPKVRDGDKWKTHVYFLDSEPQLKNTYGAGERNTGMSGLEMDTRSG